MKFLLGDYMKFFISGGGEGGLNFGREEMKIWWGDSTWGARFSGGISSHPSIRENPDHRAYFV